jgi:hypothetical protein
MALTMFVACVGSGGGDDIDAAENTASSDGRRDVVGCAASPGRLLEPRDGTSRVDREMVCSSVSSGIIFVLVPDGGVVVIVVDIVHWTTVRVVRVYR